MTKRASQQWQMPKNSPRRGASRPAFLRIMEIHKCIVAGNYPNCASLAAEIEVSEKSIQRDISFMRDQWGLPLEYDEVRHGYRYTKPVHDFPILQLSKDDLVALFLARHALEPLRGTVLEGMLTESFRKIADACPGIVSFQWQDLDEAFSVKAAGVLTADVTLFNQLLTAVGECKVVSFRYEGLKGKGKELRKVNPYHLGQIDHGWYLLAWDNARNAMRTFALQRISDVQVLEDAFVRDPNFKATEHLNRGFGVWSYDAHEKAKTYDVTIRFYDYAARIVGERVWHPSQSISKSGKDGAIEFKVRLPGLEEITRWVLSWGSKAVVLGPKELKDNVTRELNAMVRSYGKD
ncbi:putative DNA-binding transcriptional regulator YafY [Roseimicrobium gellanilyticum]|uniref:Putative DNA-binding transcriptional regulator YafY n=1 Tax=Roseimicrobium gellanilyticum TaxID=748857 RepID=A0A366HFT8_9BACT|nr:WYL domain-containing protein [Roseimicrobium gellanilyticum]RBP41433.1 putative DNA-binding transcriptional regulator YafY [Roseimicrobium gellanilyticum]